MACLNYENKRGSGRKLKVHFDLPEEDDYPIPEQRHSCSSISSDSSLDSDDAVKVDYIMDDFESKFDGNGYSSPVWSIHGGSAIQSPPTQLMSSPGYDPNRIPSSVFGGSPNPFEWSTTSNESLFSIHIGNCSFSRDLALTFNISGELPKTNDLVSMPMTLPPVQEVHHHKDVDTERNSQSSDTSEETTGVVLEDGHKQIETSAEVMEKTPEDHSKAATVPHEEVKNYASISYRSMESDISTRSFQFPILTLDGGRISSSTVESEKHEKNDYQQPPLPEAETAPTPKAEKTPAHGGRSWCFCFSFSCSPCY